MDDNELNLTIDVPDDHINPNFKKRDLCHDWKNYVPDNWRKNWNLFTDREKRIIAIMCEKIADDEEWD